MWGRKRHPAVNFLGICELSFRNVYFFFVSYVENNCVTEASFSLSFLMLMFRTHCEGKK